MISKVFACVLMFALLGTLAACRPALPPTRAETGTPSPLVPRSTVPPGVDPNAIRATSPEELATLQSLARSRRRG
ncbi:MAG: hypothetical protein ACP5HM_13130 [Anaerolineae bacterium]